VAHQQREQLAARDAADGPAEDFRQLAHRRLLDRRTDGLPADDARDDLDDDRKKRFHVCASQEPTRPAGLDMESRKVVRCQKDWRPEAKKAGDDRPFSRLVGKRFSILYLPYPISCDTRNHKELGPRPFCQTATFTMSK